MLFTVPSTGGFERKLYAFLVLSINTKKSAKQEYHFVERKNEGRKLDTNLSMRRLEFMPRNLD
jgi:hypothetical protein